jgi:uncharacterized protein YprB with RNaseH-like and TPR domain
VSDASKVLLLDIEASSLEADFGHCYCFGYKWLGEKRPRILSMTDYAKPCTTCKRVDTMSDKRLMQTVYPLMSQADVWVGWYSKGYDIRFLNTRMLDAGLPPLPPVAHVDLYWTARWQLKLSSNRLASVQDFLQLKASKTPLNKRVWRQAQAGHGPSLRYIEEHCLADVEVLEQAYEKLRPLVRSHPHVRGQGPCRVCGSEKLQRRGLAVGTWVKPRYRYQCQECGAWQTR